MTKRIFLPLSLSVMAILGFSQCQQEAKTQVPELNSTIELNGHQTLEEYGKHLVTIAGCHDCHTPRKMGPQGPEFDMDLQLSGHPAGMPLPEIDRLELEQKGMAATQTLTAWIGPWGVSYAANLTSDASGIGNWSEEQFFTALREGKFKGLKNARTLLPPMPWDMIGQMTDQELRAVFAYLKSTKPVDNLVPQPLPPLSAMK